MSVGHTPETAVHEHPELGFVRKYIFSTDHKIIGIQFLFSGLIFLLIGGILALLVRIQLGWPHSDIPILGKAWRPANEGHRMDPAFYNMLFSMHATIMIFFVIIPMLGGSFGNFTIPLMVGAKDMAFPKLNMMSYWFMWPAFIIILVGFFVDGGAPSNGWTSYPLIASLTMPPGQGFQSPAGMVRLASVGYDVQPAAGAPPSANRPARMTRNAGHMNQYDIIFSLGNAMSLAPIMSGIVKLPKAPARIGMITKKIMIVACMLNSML